MPQLDSSIIITQLLWLIFIFSLFYGLILYTILPLIVTTLKLRNNFIELHNTTKSDVDIKWTQFFSAYTSSLKECINVCKIQGFKTNLPNSILVDHNVNLLQKINALFIIC